MPNSSHPKTTAPPTQPSQPRAPSNLDVRINYRAEALRSAATALAGGDASDPAAYAENVITVAGRFETYLRYGVAGRQRP